MFFFFFFFFFFNIFQPLEVKHHIAFEICYHSFEVVLNHSGTILKRFEPGELLELTVDEARRDRCSATKRAPWSNSQVLTAAKTDEFGDSDSRCVKQQTDRKPEVGCFLEAILPFVVFPKAFAEPQIQQLRWTSLDWWSPLCLTAEWLATEGSCWWTLPLACRVLRSSAQTCRPSVCASQKTEAPCRLRLTGADLKLKLFYTNKAQPSWWLLLWH